MNREFGERIDPGPYLSLDLMAHRFLAEVPLHDVWRVRLPGSTAETTVLEVRDLMGSDRLTAASPVVRALFAVRWGLGKVFRWDTKGVPTGSTGSWIDRLPDEDASRSDIEPGSPEGPFTTLYADDREVVNEALNATVHAFLVVALSADDHDRDLYWAVYVRPGGFLTRAYMSVIDPFRRFIVYPTILRRLRSTWDDQA